MAQHIRGWNQAIIFLLYHKLIDLSCYYFHMSQYEIAKKELIFKQVHCTGFFSEIPEMYCLKYNTYDNRWYFYKKNQRQLYVGCATENPASWKHNPRYELMYKDFSGFVAKIDLIQVSTTRSCSSMTVTDTSQTALNLRERAVRFLPRPSILITVATVLFRLTVLGSLGIFQTGSRQKT